MKLSDSFNNVGNPFRFDDPSLVKIHPRYPKFGKALVILRLLVLVASALLIAVPYLMFYHGGNLIGRRNAGFPILRFWGRIAIACMGLKPVVYGVPMKQGGVIAANHVSLIDTIALFATFGGYMMPKSELRSWPVIGFFTKLSGAQFLVRNAGQAEKAVAEMSERLRMGDVMVFHPEGTTTDGQRLIRFRTPLFGSLLNVPHQTYVQPVALHYHAPKGASDNYYGWWGTLPFFGYVFEVASLCGRRELEVHFLEPIPVSGDRKALAERTKAAIGDCLKARLKARGVEWKGD